ncbi:MAG: succinate dehydrogenase cytochrome b subunit [Myxococcota bacterium]|nr:succinate dehydrogenase cytochrome b subunit [Myxococcota bacterium]
MRFLQSTLGLKVIMALTGIVLVGFVVVHMIGNLQIFIPHSGPSGESAIDHYGAMLQGSKEVVWAARLVLLSSVAGHIASAVALRNRSHNARPKGYKLQKWFSDSYAVRTMRWGGVILLLFIIYHLLHFTVGMDNEVLFTKVSHCEKAAAGLTCHVRANVIAGFSNEFISIFYIVAQVALGLHLTHGVWSLFRTLGVTSDTWNARSKQIAMAIGFIITVGNCAIPLSVLMGIVK